MKKFIQRVQDLGEKAAHLKQIVEAAPGQAAQLRDTVLVTARELQQVRSDVQSVMSGLKAENDEHLTRALREVNDAAQVFLEAGYGLAGVDMDITPIQRLTVHLEKVESVAAPVIRQLAAAQAGRPTVQALLESLARADVLADGLHLSHLEFNEVVVHVGPIPMVRLSWRAPYQDEEKPSALPPTSLPDAVTVSPPPLPTFGQGSFFEPRPVPVKPASVHEVSPPAASSSNPVADQGMEPRAGSEAPEGDWRTDALARFKKMPNLQKRKP